MSIVRFHITADQITQLTVVAYRENIMANALGNLDNCTVWTMGHSIPNHIQAVYEKCRQRLGTVAMDGREAKHIISCYVEPCFKMYSFLAVWQYFIDFPSTLCATDNVFFEGNLKFVYSLC